jgi:hypothetical protein
VYVEAEKLKFHVRDQDNVRTAIGAIHNCNVVEHSRVETASEDVY